MEQNELLKLSNDETIVVKPAGREGTVGVLSTAHYQSIMVQHLSDENSCKKPDLHRQQNTESPFKNSKKV